MVKMAWERGGARARSEDEEGHMGKGCCHLFVDLVANIPWRIQHHAPQNVEFLWRTSHGAPQNLPRWTLAQ